jgi:hypothetical protein
MNKKLKKKILRTFENPKKNRIVRFTKNILNLK